ncbi:glycerophosphodiester phosphodiesterase [Arthrobacter oryzae]|uniref:Glycerophosphodiester phosphodiesterase n=1 Tax=Arthrobacter oryzae TaxID=409290 RepID=A0A3N0BZL5_9MICC|nr:glycerophosphodiester phosphodiesterase [Arthrobacter oryzae]
MGFPPAPHIRAGQVAYSLYNSRPVAQDVESNAGHDLVNQMISAGKQPKGCYFLGKDHIQQIFNPAETGGISRRDFMIVSSASLGLAAGLSGCRDAGAERAPARNFTVTSLLGTSPFYIAHRGSGDTWPEHTALAYASAVDYGVKAIEISVCATSDGVLICHHDTNTLRLTGEDLEIAEQPYERISQLRNDATKWLGPKAPTQPLPRLADVLDRFAASHVIFIEDKQSTNTDALLDLMDSYPDSRNHFVWKQTSSSSTRLKASARGYRTWGYFDAGSADTFDKYAPNHDFLGLYHAAPDSEMTALMTYGKPVIVWEVHTRWMRERLLRLGVRGIMCSNIPYVTSDIAHSTSDEFATGIRSPGDLPWTINWALQPRIQPETESIRLDDGSEFSYTMGSLCPVPASDYSINYEVRWPEAMPPNGGQIGIAFGLRDDTPYRPNFAESPAGYHLMIDGKGTLALSSRVVRGNAAEVIASSMSQAPREGQWLKFTVRVAAGGIRCSRVDSGVSSFAVADETHRGGYFVLCKGYNGRQPVEFRSVSVAR